MSEKVEITTYISDMIAVEREILAPVEKQLKDPDLEEFQQVKTLLTKLQSTVSEHVLHLEHHLEALGGHPISGIKTAVAEVMGAAASAVQSARRTKISKALRDDHTAISLTCVAYEMLYTSALVTRNEATSTIALQHLRDLTPITMELSELIPSVVVKELLESDPSLDGSILPDASENIFSAWRSGAKEREKSQPHQQYATV